MKTPLFITSSNQVLANWREAFPQAICHVGLPKKFDALDEAVIFLDFMHLPADGRVRWLEACINSGRPTIVLSSTPDEKEALEVVQAGAVGYGHSFAAAKRLREMSLVASNGGLWLGNKLMKRVMNALGNTVPAREVKNEALSDLTPREHDVAKLVSDGATNAEISSSLGISERTVKAHITASFTKLSVRNRVELALLLHNIRTPGAFIQN